MAAFIFFLLLLGVIAFVIQSFRRSQRRQQLVERLNYGMSDIEEEQVSLWDGAADLLQLGKINKLLLSSTLTRKFDMMIRRSMMKVSLLKAMFIFLMASLVPAVPAYLYWKTGVSLVGSLLALPIILWILLAWKAKSQQDKLDRQLPALISSFLTTINAGGTPIQALQSVAQNSPQPIAGSMANILEGIQLGRPPQAAWQDWADFWGTKSAKLLATGIKIKWETGGQMSAILRHVLETLEFNRRMELRVSTLTAQSKLSAWVLSLLPVALALLTKTYRPDLFDAMTSDPLGQDLLIAATVMTVVGFFWLQKIAKLKN